MERAYCRQWQAIGDFFAIVATVDNDVFSGYDPSVADFGEPVTARYTITNDKRANLYLLIT